MHELAEQQVSNLLQQLLTHGPGLQTMNPEDQPDQNSLESQNLSDEIERHEDEDNGDIDALKERLDLIAFGEKHYETESPDRPPSPRNLGDGEHENF